MADYRWAVPSIALPSAGGEWTTPVNWDLNSSYPKAGDTADITTVSGTTTLTMSIGADFNFPTALYTDQQRSWIFGAAGTMRTLTLTANATIGVYQAVAATQYMVLWYPRMTGASYNLVIDGGTASGGGRFAPANNLNNLAWSYNRLQIGDSAGYAGAANTAMPSTNWIDFGFNTAPGSTGFNTYDSASGGTAATVAVSMRFYSTGVTFQPVSTAVTTFTGNKYFENPNSSVTLTFNRNSTWTGTWTGNGTTTVRKAGAGVWTVTGATIETSVNAIVLDDNTGFAFDTNTLQNVAWGPYDGATVRATYPANAVIGALTGSNPLYVVRNFTIGSSLSNVTATHSGDFDEVSAGASAAFTITKAGTGVQTLSGAASGYESAWIINAGVLNAASSFALGGGSTGVTVNSGGTLRISASVTRVSSPLTLSGSGATIGGTLQGAMHSNSAARSYQFAGATLAAPTTIRVESGANLNLISSAAITGTAGQTLTKTGAGTLYFNQSIDNTYAGGTVIESGTMVVARNISTSGNSPLGTGTITLGATDVTTTATLRATPAVSGTASSFARTLTLRGATGLTTTYGFESTNASALTVAIAGSSPFTYTGTGGTRRLSLGSVGATSTWDTNIPAVSGYTIELRSSSNWTLNNKTYTFTGGITTTAGTLTFSSVTYTAGTITITGGTLASTGTALVAADMSIGGGTVTAAVNCTSGSGTVAVSAGTVSSTAFTATTLTGSGGTLSGTFTVSTINASSGTYSGDFTTTNFNITGGTYTTAAAKYRGAIAVTAASALTINGQLLNPTSGPATSLTLTSTGGATVTIQPTSNLNDYTGDTTITSGTIARAITSQDPSVADNGKVFGNSKVIVEGTLRTSGTGSQLGRLRYKGGLTLKAGSTLAIGAA